MNLGAEGLLRLRDCTAEGDERGTLGDAGNRKALAGKPRGDLRDIGDAEAEARTELLRRQPLVIAGRARIELGGQELAEIGLLGRGHAETQRKRIELAVGGSRTRVDGMLRMTADITRHRHSAGAVDRSGDAVLHGRLGDWGKCGEKDSDGEDEGRSKT